MRKRDKKLQIYRETLHRLETKELPAGDLAKVRGAAVAVAETGVWTSCIQPNCCGDTMTGGTG